MHRARVGLDEKQRRIFLRDEAIHYVDSHVTMAYPTVNSTFTDPESAFSRLNREERLIMLEAFKGVGKGISKKGIFFGAAFVYSAVTGAKGTEYGFNVDTDAGDTFCAERVGLERLTRIRGFNRVEALGIVANIFREEEQGHEGPRAPCHGCREQLRRVVGRPELPVIMGSSRLDDFILTKLGNLLPLGFLKGRKFDRDLIESFNIPTLRVFERDDLVYRAKNADPIAASILRVSDAAKKEYPKGMPFKKQFHLPGEATGVAAGVSKPVRMGEQTVYEDIVLTAFSPSLSGKSAVRGLLTEVQRTCGLRGVVSIVAIHGSSNDFSGGIPAPTSGARQALYDRVFIQNSNALFVLSTEGSKHIVTVDARHLLPLGKPVMDYLDLDKHEALTHGIVAIRTPNP